VLIHDKPISMLIYEEADPIIGGLVEKCVLTVGVVLKQEE